MIKAKTLLVDGNFLLKRSINGARDEYTQAGNLGGIYSFLTTIRMLIKQYSINKVVVCWDGEDGGVYRYHIDSNYKANRSNKSWYKPIQLSSAQIDAELKKKESTLFQRKRIQQYCEELYIRQIEVPKIEGDDLIAKYCQTNHKNEEIILYTNDQDFFQLLKLGIDIHLDNRKKIINSGSFILDFPYRSENALVIKILTGDDSDNIQGIPRLGQKTLLKHFPELAMDVVTVREICKKAYTINKERKKPLKVLQNIVEGVERLKTNKKLMDLSEPILTNEAIGELEQLEMPLAETDEEGNERGSRALYKLMMEDKFLDMFSKYGNFVTYVTPFYPMIAREKEILKIWEKENI